MIPYLYIIISTPRNKEIIGDSAPWFTKDMIICQLNYNNNWMRAYLKTNLKQIKSEAQAKGYRFVWTEDPDVLDEFGNISVTSNADVATYDILDEDLFYLQGCPSGIYKRVDNDHFVVWYYKDMVHSAVDIDLPATLFDKCRSAEYYGEPVDLLQQRGNTNENNYESSDDFHLDPINRAHDQYFHNLVASCEKCDAKNMYKIPKAVDFYNVMESETCCARCKKDSWTISAGDLGYYFVPKDKEWQLCSFEIPKGTGYCEDCRPYYKSKVEDLVLKCRCGVIIKHPPY